ncbi:MAG: MFS transporter, partial [Rhodospirillales bacterium]|nr:MFS transporter [Rhodospirillales bacterium]
MAPVRTRWDIVAIAFAAGFMVGMQVGKVPPALPMLQAELELSRVVAGLIASSYYAIGAVLGVAGGLLVDRLGIRRMVVVGGAAMALASAAGGFADSGGPLLAARIVEGFGFVTLTVAGPKMLVTAADAGVRRFLLGVWGTYMPIGIALSLVIATASLEAIGWRGLWLVNAGLILLFVAVFLWGAARKRWRAPAVSGGGFDAAGVRAILARPGPWLFGLSFAIFAVEWQALMAWLPTFLIETQARALTGAALFTALFVLVTAAVSIACARLLQRGVARWPLLAITFAGMGVSAAALFAPFTPDDAKLPLALCFALASGPLPAVCFEGGVAHAPSPGQVAMAGGFVAQGAALGAVLGPPLLAAVTEALGG